MPRQEKKFPSSQFSLSPSTSSDSANTSNSSENNVDDTKSELKKDLLDDIESINPDHEQRKLAIEVSREDFCSVFRYIALFRAPTLILFLEKLIL